MHSFKLPFPGWDSRVSRGRAAMFKSNRHVFLHVPVVTASRSCSRVPPTNISRLRRCRRSSVRSARRRPQAGAVSARAELATWRDGPPPTEGDVRFRQACGHSEGDPARAVDQMPVRETPLGCSVGGSAGRIWTGGEREVVPCQSTSQTQSQNEGNSQLRQ